MRRGVVVALLVFMLMTGLFSTALAEDRSCRPWSTYTVWTVVFCDYSLWDVFEGIVGWWCSFVGWGCGGARGWYDDDPPTEDDWLRWCMLTPEDGVTHCMWSHTVHLESMASKSGLPTGTANAVVDPPGFSNSNVSNTLLYAVLITPPGTTEVSLQCAQYASAVRSDVGALAQSWVRTLNPDAYSGSVWREYSNSEYQHMLLVQSPAGLVEQSSYITLTVGSVYTHHVPTVYSDHVNYIRLGIATRAFNSSQHQSADAHAAVTCAVYRYVIGTEIHYPVDIHSWYEQNAPVPPGSGFSWSSLSYSAITPVSTTVLMDVGELVEGDCITLFPSVGPYTVTIGVGPISVVDFPVGTDEYEICYSTRSFDLVFLDYDIGLLLLVFLGLGGIGAVATWLRS